MLAIAVTSANVSSPNYSIGNDQLSNTKRPWIIYCLRLIYPGTNITIILCAKAYRSLNLIRRTVPPGSSNIFKLKKHYISLLFIPI